MHPGGRGNDESKGLPEEKHVVFHPEALYDLIDAAHYYEACAEGLGDRFLDNVEKALHVISGNPLLFVADELGKRKYVLKKFPYLIIYKIKEDCIYILAAAHGKRKPGYWESRDS
jgi:toxin ParE1/3/4